MKFMYFRSGLKRMCDSHNFFYYYLSSSKKELQDSGLNRVIYESWPEMCFWVICIGNHMSSSAIWNK